MSDSNTPRSPFPTGKDLVARFVWYEDNQNVAVDVWALKDGEKYFTVNLICPHKAPDDARWLIGSIQKPDGLPVWGYKDDPRVQAGFFGLVYPLEVDDVTYLVFQTKGEPHVAHAIPLRDLLLPQEPQRPLTEQMTQKCQVAAVLELPVRWTASELVVIKHQAEQRRQAAEAEREQKLQQKRAERQAKVDAIMARQQLTVVSNGRQVTAIWVVDDEWKILPPKTTVIAGYFGGDDKFYPEETFQVFKKKGQEATKRFQASVDRSTQKTASQLPTPSATKVVLLDGQPYEVPTFKATDELRQHQAAGLNSGALRGVEEAPGQFQLFQVTSHELVPMENFQLLN